MNGVGRNVRHIKEGMDGVGRNVRHIKEGMDGVGRSVRHIKEGMDGGVLNSLFNQKCDSYSALFVIM